MKQAQTSKEAIKIFKAMEDRLAELWNKLTSGSYNQATQFAYEIGFISDIDDCLKKLRVKRTIVKQDNVKEIEMKDIEPLKKSLTALENHRTRIKDTHGLISEKKIRKTKEV